MLVSGKCLSFNPDPFLLRDSCADSPWLPGHLWPGRRQAVVSAWQAVTRCLASFADTCAAEPAGVPGHGQPTAPTPRTGKSCLALSPCSVPGPPTGGMGREHPAWVDGRLGLSDQAWVVLPTRR